MLAWFGISIIWHRSMDLILCERFVMRAHQIVLYIIKIKERCKNFVQHFCFIYALLCHSNCIKNKERLFLYTDKMLMIFKCPSPNHNFVGGCAFKLLPNAKS